MTFQGDVGGIGLADLLQSLARGRDGILSLIGRQGLQATLGVEEGLLHLLPDPSEGPDTWRDRARDAYVGDPNSRIDLVRMTEIARAQRIENIYRLLDADTLHFRFVPGPLPKPPEDAMITRSETGFSRTSRRDTIWCAPISVDGLLLEYARLKDEAVGAGPAFRLSLHTVLMLFDTSQASEDMGPFLSQCDGTSTMVEIADRLGWPLRQMRITTAVALSRRILRTAQPEELLILAQRELHQGNAGRASSRLVAWYEVAPPGPLTEQDAEFLAHEWNAGRLQSAIKAMPGVAARALLRRVDCVLFNAAASAERWKEYADRDQADPISALRVLVCQIRSGVQDVPPMRELLSFARSFNERRQPMRAVAILRVAAERQPETSGARLELGLGLLHAGFPMEGAPWILEAARTLIEENQGEKAVAPLRTLIEISPSNRDARKLMSRARAGAVRRKLAGRHALLVVAGIGVLVATGWVQLDSRKKDDRRLGAIEARVADPAAALAMLEQEFPGDDSEEVQRLRAAIEDRRKSDVLAARAAWTVDFRDAQKECESGDPLQGLRKALALPPPPPIDEEEEYPPSITGLFETIAARGETALNELSDVTQDHKEQVHAEQRAAKLFTDLKAILGEHEASADARALQKRLDDMQTRLETRAEERAKIRAAHLKKENQAHQDLLLAAARAHAQAGDHARSLATYKELLQSDETGKLAPLLAAEIGAEESRSSAITKSRQLARSGKHGEARAVLEKTLDNFGDYLIPWRVETVPTGARARFPDGTERVTPFTIESTFGERISMTLEKDGCEAAELSIEDPGDRVVYLTRSPERWWRTKGRVEALPLAVGEDHVLCDRAGKIVRLERDGTTTWERQLSTLGGIARTPALLPNQRGKLVLVTEDGEAYLCEAATGEIEGPMKMGSPPAAGPFACSDGVRVRFRDGRTALWSQAADPSIATRAEEEGDCASEESGGSIVVLRRSASSGTSLKSPWTGWVVDIGDKACTLRAPGEDKPNVSFRREGTWSYVAWEAPHALVPRGRLWVADGLGLRSYLP